MKNRILLIMQLLFIFPLLAQERVSESNSNNVTRQGFGRHEAFDMAVGFVNPKPKTEGSAYYFDNWNTEGLIYIKDKGRFGIKKVNINLYTNKLEAIYDDDSVFTFDSENLIKIVINNKVFRAIRVNKELKIFEVFFNNKVSVYRNYRVIYSEASKNPMVNRKNNKYFKRAQYYIYGDSKLTKVKLSKKSFSKLFKTDKVSQQSISKYIDDYKLSLNKETDLLKVLNYISK